MNELFWNSTRGFWQIGVALHDFGDDLAQALSGKELRHYNHALLEGTEICFPILPWQLAYSTCGLPFNLTFIGFSSSACFLIPEFLWVLSPSLSWYSLLGGCHLLCRPYSHSCIDDCQIFTLNQTSCLSSDLDSSCLLHISSCAFYKFNESKIEPTTPGDSCLLYC